MGGSDEDRGSDLTVDIRGNVFLTGWFNDVIQADLSTGSVTLESNGLRDIFVQKLDEHGTTMWLKSIGGQYSENAHAVTVDAGGNIYIAGSFRETVDFDPGAESYIAVSNGRSDIFVLKLNARGEFLWVKTMGGERDDLAIDIVVDRFGGIYTTGEFNRSVDFDPGSGGANLVSNGGSDIYIQKLNALGDHMWVKALGGKSWDTGYALDVDDDGNVYVCGIILGRVDLDPGPDSSIVETHSATNDVFMLKLDEWGNFVWGHSVGGKEHDYAYSLTLDAESNIYVAGVFERQVDFDPSFRSDTLHSNGQQDCFIVKLDDDGNLLWANSVGGVGFDRINSIVTDVHGNIYATGKFNDTVDFDPGQEQALLIANDIGVDELFVQKLDASGEFVWAIATQSTSITEGRALGLDLWGNVYTTGLFTDTTDFNPRAGVNNYVSAGDDDIFVFKMNPSIVSVPETYAGNDRILFPNPVSQILSIDSETGQSIERVEICDVNGHVVISRSVPFSGRLNLDVSHIADGTYFVRIYSAKRVFVSKIVIQ